VKVRLSLLSVCFVWLNAPPAWAAEPPNAKMLEALRPFHGVVGGWKGHGTHPKSSGWTETVESTWGFREKDGRVAFEWRVAGGDALEAAVVSYNPEKKVYRFIARNPAGKVMHFEGKPAGEQTIRLLRTEETHDDPYDVAEIKLVRAGDKLIYVLGKKVGKSSVEPIVSVELFREGAPLSSFAEGPRCIVTGGAGRVEVDYEGKTYHVACEAAKEEFLSHPERYVPKTP
jgi:YHS domain-containing protein